jgi:hypothetical protein
MPTSDPLLLMRTRAFCHKSLSHPLKVIAICENFWGAARVAIDARLAPGAVVGRG